MGRKTQTLTIAADGRDHGKAYFLTEMPAARSEKWALRALLALSKSGVSLPDGVHTLGMAALMAVGLRALLGLPFADVEPLLDEMLVCVQFVPDASRPAVMRALVPDDIEEVQTMLLIRSEVFALHVGFSIADELSKFRALSASLPTAPPTSPKA